MDFEKTARDMAEQSSGKGGFSDLLSTAKHQVMAVLVVGMFVWGGSAIAFYFNVQNTLANQSDAIKRNTNELKDVDIQLKDKADRSDIEEIKNSIRDINKTQKDIYRILIKQRQQR